MNRDHLVSAEGGRKTEKDHWDAVFQSPIRKRLPSRFDVGVLNITRLLARHVRPGNRYIEIGCAPGKLLAWVASVLRADVSGLDYSKQGLKQCRDLFAALGIEAHLYHDDFFEHHLPSAAFDVVTSFGLIEHFDDPRPVVQCHLDLLRPGGVALMTVPNYGGIYGSLQKRCDPENLALHNLHLMDPRTLAAIAVSPDNAVVNAYPFGNMSPWLINFDKRLPRFLARSMWLGLNALGLLQPLTIAAIAPLLVLEIRKRSA